MRIRVRFGSNSEIYRVPCDENEKTKDVIERAIETYKKCQGKEHLHVEVKYRTRAIISRSRFEDALVYKPRILSLKNEEFSFLVHKLSAI